MQFYSWLSMIRSTYLHVLASCFDVRYEKTVRLLLNPACRGWCFNYFRSIYMYWCPTRFSCQMMFVSYNSNIMGTTSIAGTVCILLEHLSAHPGFIGVRVTQSLVFCLVFYRPLFVLFVVCLLGIILSALPLTASNYLFGIVKHFLLLINR